MPRTGGCSPAGPATYDPYTGETHLSFAGALSVGNTSFGNFGERLANPSIDVDADGNGSLSADVSTRGPGPGGFGAADTRRRRDRTPLPTTR